MHSPDKTIIKSPKLKDDLIFIKHTNNVKDWAYYWIYDKDMKPCTAMHPEDFNRMFEDI